METITLIILLTAFSGACIPLGGVLGTISRLRPDWLRKEYRHFVIALGGGILVGSTALVLVPEGVDSLQRSLWSICFFFSGGFTFFLIERRLGLQRRESPQFLGMLLDYVPEAVALGGLVALGSSAAPLLALLIGLQNLPEGFNAYRELTAIRGATAIRTLLSMAGLVPIGPAAGLLGYYYLSGHQSTLGAIMLFSSGGILYLIFQDIAPQSRLKRHWGPPLGAVIGFGIVLLSSLLLD